MDLNLRNAIIENVTGNSEEQLESTIIDAIQGGEEKMLPGLGVFFEIIWNKADEQDRQEMLQNLKKGIPQ